MRDTHRLTDQIALDRGKGLAERVGLTGTITAELRGPDGSLKARCQVPNLITNVGDAYYAGRAALSSGLPAQITGFRLGTGSTAVAKTGAGAALVTYLAGSNKANDATFPQVAGGVVTYKRTYAAGEATTASPITECVLVNDSIAGDVTSPAGNTISRGLLVGIGSKNALDSLTVTWSHSAIGS